MRRGLLLFFAAIVFAQSSSEVLSVFTDAAAALANDDADAFMSKFDSKMANYAALRDEIQGLLSANEVSSTVEVVNDSGDDQKRMLDLDWLLVIDQKNAINGQKETRRKLLKCQVEHQGKQWKITVLDPIDFFKY